MAGHLLKVKNQHQEDLPENKSITKLANIFRSSHEHQASDNENPAPETHQKYQHMHHECSNKRNRWQTHKRAGKFYEETQMNYKDKQGSFQRIQNGELKFDEERLKSHKIKVWWKMAF